MSLLGFAAEPEVLQCSRAECRELADWSLSWRNPKIHLDGRVKTWLACQDHREFLSEFLAARRFLLGCEPLGGADAGAAQ